MSIKVLDNNTINKIAAGEVIENAASVVKELVENSIDAGANNIVIEVEEGGTKLVKVSDDGIGFEKDDIEIAFLQHSTSKLTDIKDLETLNSYGFRGEALSSLASVSKVVLTTKSRQSKNSYGYRYVTDFGIKSSIEETAANFGTTIEIINLFKNVPVRKKFLKGFPKENALIEDIVIKLALSNSNISFKLVVDGKVRFNSNGDSDLKSILYSLYGRGVTDNLISINDEFDGISITGYIARPIIVRNNKNDEIYFVNSRYVKSKTIAKAIEGAYDQYLMQHKFPLVVLMISIDNKKVDVNVHPKKLEVRFSSDELIYMAVYTIIQNSLKSISLIHDEKLIDAKDEIDDNSFANSYGNEDSNYIEFPKAINTDINTLPTLSDISRLDLKEGLELSNLYKNISNDFEEKPFIKKTLWDDYKYIGQIFNTYILIEFEEKLYIIDQHAAHEKINYEKLMKQYRMGGQVSQKIFPSIIIRLTPLQYESIESNIDEFKKVGYEIELFGDNDIKVDAVPYNILNIGNEKLLLDMIDSFTTDTNKENYSSIAEKIASISCKKSIKANHILSENEIRSLLKELFKLDNPYNCPHGRPTIISLSKLEFEKKFGRVI